MPEKLQVNCLCNRISVPAIDYPQLTYILTELSPGTSHSNSRMPINLGFVLDCSGDVDDEDFEAFKKVLHNCIDNLQPQDIFSLIQFGGRVRTVIPAQKVKDVEKMQRQVARLKCSGKRNLAPGISEALKQLHKYHEENQINRMILLVAGPSEDEDQALYEITEQAGVEQIPIIGIGYGREWNEDLLAAIVKRSNQDQSDLLKESLSYVPKAEYLEQTLDMICQSLQIVAREVEIFIRLMRGVQVRQIWQVRPAINNLEQETPDNSIISIEVGDLEKSGIAFLVEVVVPQRAAGSIRIAQAEVIYKIPGHETQKEIVNLVVNFSKDVAVTNPLDSYVMDFVEAAQVFRLQTEALQHTEEGDVQSAIPKLRQAAAILISQGETTLADQMRAEADYYLRQFGQISREGKRAIRMTGRKIVKNIGFEN